MANKIRYFQLDLQLSNSGSVTGQIVKNDLNTVYESGLFYKDGSRAATGNFDLGNNRITNLANPIAAQDAATKSYVDAAVQGLDIKGSVRVATTANITLSGTQTIDGIVLVAGDRVLVKNQSTGSQNGIYVVAAGAWARASDADNINPTNGDVSAGMFTFVEEGTTYADTGWVLVTDNPITLGTTSLTFTQFSGGGSYSGDEITIHQTGTQFSIKSSSTAGQTLISSGTPNTAPSWGTLMITGGGTGLTSYTAGDLTYYSTGNSLTKLGIGAAGTFLKSTGSAPSWASITVTDVANGAALTKSDDTNVTLTLGGTPASALLKAVSLTLGWTGVLAVSRGGTGIGTAPANGQLLIGNGSTYTLGTLTAGTGIQITNSSGSITITATGAVGNANFVDKEKLTTDGSTFQFTLAYSPIAGSEHIYLNGQLLYAGGTYASPSNDYGLTGSQIAFTFVPLSTDIILITYRK